MRDLGAVFLIDDEATPLVSLESDIVKTKTRGIRAAPNSDKDNIGVDLCFVRYETRDPNGSTYGFLLSALGSFNVDLNAGVVHFTSGHLGVQFELQALLGEELLSLF
jgi:hypothetical protein